MKKSKSNFHRVECVQSSDGRIHRNEVLALEHEIQLKLQSPLSVLIFENEYDNLGDDAKKRTIDKMIKYREQVVSMITSTVKDLEKEMTEVRAEMISRRIKGGE